MIHSLTMTTPDGPFTIIGNREHVLASGWTVETTELLALIHPELRPAQAPAGQRVLGDARAAVEAYYVGDVWAPSRIPVHQRSTPGREHAWEVLRAVAPGSPLTYAQYADHCGTPTAVRAAAGACARNATALFVPCHRIIRSDGTLGGFRYGLEIKRSLLEREAAAS